ncbi:Uncharacterised protein [Mycobacteroides abscessus subsp. abscessus]|nr:Uncharacterised protein [Mycobacteroides abscessus subsp. abscessus]
MSSKDWKRSRHLVPSCASSTRCTLGVGSGGASLCSFTNASRNGSANWGGIAASITDNACPTFMAPPLSSPSTLNSSSAAFSKSSALTSSADVPVSRLPTPRTARPAMPAGRLASLVIRLSPPRRISAMSPHILQCGVVALTSCRNASCC